ncbi:MAG: class I SAM-dependent methyltransferase [Nanoarchaeota archaeon]|nr:class I SAM-dependent methyltransferase [Nanoarchaeota archaeon]
MEQKIIAVRDTCRVCGFKPLIPILSLGNLYMSDFVDDASQQDENSKVPLELVLCNKKDGGCGLLQLKHTASHEAMYRNYWYRSGMNKTMTNELNGIAKKIEELVDLKSGDCLIDIGANDGTLLRGYSINGIKTIGFEPAINLMKWAHEGTTRIINDFFGYHAWQKEFGDFKARAITAIAMFYDLEDPNTFVSDVVRCLDKEGVFIIQMSYLPSMLSQNAFDNICHEHLEYYSLLSLENLFKRHNLEIFDVELNNINGGSFRTYIRHKDGGKTVKISAGAEKRVKDLRKFEEDLGLDDKEIYEDFVKNIYTLRDQLVAFLKSEHEKGKKIYVYGASTKGNTLLQFYGLDYHIITAAAERNPDKWGKKTIGTLIPIISEEQARAEKPDYFLVLPWHFMEEFKEREQEFSKSGGKFIVPLPKFEIV